MNKETKEKAVKQLNEIRNSGKFNMFLDRRKVMEYANKNNMFALVSYVGNDITGKYPELLKELDKYIQGEYVKEKEYEYTGFDDSNKEPIKVGDIVMDIKIDRVIGEIVKENNEYYMVPNKDLVNGDLERMILKEDLADDLKVLFTKI